MIDLLNSLSPVFLASVGRQVGSHSRWTAADGYGRLRTASRLVPEGTDGYGRVRPCTDQRVGDSSSSGRARRHEGRDRGRLEPPSSDLGGSGARRLPLSAMREEPIGQSLVLTDIEVVTRSWEEHPVAVDAGLARRDGDARSLGRQGWSW